MIEALAGEGECLCVCVCVCVELAAPLAPRARPVVSVKQGLWGGVEVAAVAVVTQNTRVESGSIYAGVPAKKVKDINQSDFAGEIERISNNYVMYSGWFKEGEAYSKNL